MEEFKIYCTEEQTKKALKLGAPIEETPMIDILRNEIGKHCLLQGSNACWFPTAEQMIGWLEEQGVVIDIAPYSNNKGWCFYINSEFYLTDDFSRKEANLAAIDAALEYLSSKK